MHNKINPLELNKGFMFSNLDRHVISLSHNAGFDGFQKRSRITNVESKTLEPVVIINADILPPLKDIPSYGSVTKSNTNKDNFYRAIGPIAVLGQCFGLMPVAGVLGKDASSLKFSWRSWRVCLTGLCILIGTFLTSLCVIRLFTYGIDIHSISTLLFYGSTFSILLLFLRLAKHWPRICLAIELEESRSAPYVVNKNHTTLVAKFKICAFFILFMAFVEHVMSIMSGVTMVYGCDKDNPTYVGYFFASFPQVFTYTSFAIWKAFFLQLYNTFATFHWSYGDLFIILMSVCLASRFDKLNSCINAAKGKNLPEHFWKVIRNEYANLALLVAQIDENINELTLLSFANNLYIICMQLFNTFNSAHDENAALPCWKKLYNGIFTTIYFIYSFIFLISRFLLVSLSASRIYTSSRVPLDTLFTIASESYCIEVQRFIDHVTNDVVAFTGMKFFYITRGLILTIAGTVVTYELVLVQFNQPSPSVQANITVKDNCGASQTQYVRGPPK